MFSREVKRRLIFLENGGDLKNFNAKGTTENSNCLDIVEIYVLFKDEIVSNAKFKVFGCPGAIVSSDMFIDLIKGKNVETACLIKSEEIIESLGGLPENYVHCTELPIKAFRDAVDNYKNKNKKDVKK